MEIIFQANGYTLNNAIMYIYIYVDGYQCGVEGKGSNSGIIAFRSGASGNNFTPLIGTCRITLTNGYHMVSAKFMNGNNDGHTCLVSSASLSIKIYRQLRIVQQ